MVATGAHAVAKTQTSPSKKYVVADMDEYYPCKRRRRQSEKDEISSDEEGSTPLNHLRAFGSNLRGGKVRFVRPQSTQSSDPSADASSEAMKAARGKRVANAYLDIVFGKDAQTLPSTSIQERSGATLDDNAPSSSSSAPRMEPENGGRGSPPARSPDPGSVEDEPVPLHVPYDLPPPTFDRRSKSFRYLASQGWDPEDRRGLGASGNEGRLYPIKTNVNKGNAGLGLEAEARRRREEAELSGKVQAAPAPRKTLNAKEMRAYVREENRRAQALEFDFRGR